MISVYSNGQFTVLDILTDKIVFYSFLLKFSETEEAIRPCSKTGLEKI